VRSRREIIQHAKALDRMVGAVVVDGDSVTEEIVLEAHRILTLCIDNYRRNEPLPRRRGTAVDTGSVVLRATPTLLYPQPYPS
jgi:hypothetical protein